MSIGNISKVQTKQFGRLVEEFESARVELQEMAQGVLEDWQGQYERKSDKWQESEAGQNAEESISALEEFIYNLSDAEISENPFEV